MNKKPFFALLFVMFATSFVFGSEAPSMLDNYVDTLLELMTSKVMIFVVALILAFAGFQAYKNASPTPLIWALVAVIAISGAIPIAANIVGFGENNFTNV